MHHRSGVSALALAIGLSAALPAAAQQAIVVASGTTDSGAKTVSGTDSVTVQAGGTLSTGSNPTINWNNASTGLSIANSGTIRSTANGGRAINASGGNNVRTVTLTNNAGALIESQDDAVRINVNPTGGTIIVNNAGTIQTTNGGQAIDFDAVASSAATITINNLATGVLRSFGQDAIRPGQGAVVTNAGLIFSDGPINNSYDGVDWQQRSGIVVNQATGTISGLRHGITSDIDVNVTNAGTIIGRNGSGIGSDGTGTVVNSGTIRGVWDGQSTNGDGDGVDIDGIGTVRNTGTIEGLTAAGVDSGGRPNSAQGVAMGGGLIENAAGATITGGAQGVLINRDTNPGGVADGATVITNAGTIRGIAAEAIQFVGDFADTITTSGAIVGGSGTALDMGGGNDTLNVQSGATFTGTVLGGAGTDTITLSGGNGTLTATSGFERLAANAGIWTLSGTHSYADGIAIAASAGISGTSAILTGNNIANSGTLTFNQSANGTYAGAITGTGSLAKAGSANLTLGAQAYTGATSVAGGTLTLTGALSSTTYDVASGATLTSAMAATIASTGTPLTITNAGTISSSNATGRAINIAGSNNSRAITITNNAGGLIQSADDAVRVNFSPTGGSIVVNNAGTIQTTNGGQAIDFDAAASGAGTITINNLATGVLRSFGQDAIRPGQGAVVTNAGLIFSDGPINNSYDGVDWQGRSGIVTNQSTGTISGLRHGITSDVAVNVTNAGTIIGRNGSGIGSDGTGSVVNTGTITGQWDGVSTNGDGDGVDIDFIGTVVNSGIIQGLTATGVDSGGRPNSAEGVAMGGGSITNNAGARIEGGGTAILINHDTNAGGVADGATTIVNAGTIRGGSGRAITFVGAFADTITNSGTITGGTNGAIDLGDGNDTLALLVGSVITGVVDGGAGTDGVTLGGTGSGSFAGARNFETLAVNAGSWTVSGNSSFNSTTIGNGATLVLAGSLTSPVSVQSGGRLGGVGTIGALSVATGGTVAPGNSIGTLTVNGAYAAAAGSLYVAETSAGGASDLIAVNGAATIAAGAQIQIVRDGGTYVPGTRYTFLTATGGITGTYTVVQTAAGGTELRLVTSTNTLGAVVARTAAALPGVAQNANQAGTAMALGALGVGNAAYAQLTLLPNDADVRAGLSALSGELHPSARLAMVTDARAIESAANVRLDAPAGSGVWAQFIGRSGQDDGVAGSADADRRTLGGAGGVDIDLGIGRAGIAGGYTRTNLDVDARASTARVETKHVLAYAGGKFGAIGVRAGVGYAWSKIEAQRTVAFTSFADRLRADYDGNVLHSFVEVNGSVPLLGGTIEPFAGLEAYRIRTDGFVESGGASALRGAERKERYFFSDFGLRAATPIVDGLQARTQVAWRHGFDRLVPVSVLGFAAGGPSFVASGASMSKDAASLGLDLAWRAGERLTVTSGYAGTIGGRGDDSSMRVTVALGF